MADFVVVRHEGDGRREITLRLPEHTWNAMPGNKIQVEVVRVDRHLDGDSST